MPGELLSRNEIIRRLRLVMSGRVRHRPLSMKMIAARCGLSRVAVYNASNGIMGDCVQDLLSQVLREVDVQAAIEASISLDERMARAVRSGP